MGLQCQVWINFWLIFRPKSRSKIDAKNDIEKKRLLSKKRHQKGAEIDAKTHQKSMPELVSEKIKKIIKNHVSLKSEIIEIHWKNNCFYGLEGCMCERERY